VLCASEDGDVPSFKPVVHSDKGMACQRMETRFVAVPVYLEIYAEMLNGADEVHWSSHTHSSPLVFGHCDECGPRGEVEGIDFASSISRMRSSSSTPNTRGHRIKMYRCAKGAFTKWK
jgi:hypothetical protein